MTRVVVRAAKATTACHQCGRSGQWVSDHVPDGSLPSTVPSAVSTVSPPLNM